MKILRTPDERFENLQGYNFTPYYTMITDDDGTEIRVHHVDEGESDADPILLMHGSPTWSYLHRHMIPPLAETGRRVMSVDLVGLGRSDKPSTRDDYSLARHYEWMEKWLLANDLKNITLFCQDWGGTIGLYLVSKHPDRFARVIVANSGMPIGEGGNDFLDMWLKMMAEAKEFPWDMVFKPSFRPVISEEIFAGYLAPFPSPEYQVGILKFPSLIAVKADNPGVSLNKVAWERLKTFDKPFLTLFGGEDVVSGKGAGAKKLINHIPGAAGQNHEVHPDGGHFIQEDQPKFLVERIKAFLTVN